MKNKKYFVILFIMLICVSTFFGCAEIEFRRAIDSTNTIIDKIVITIDESKVNKAGKDITEVANKIEDDMRQFRISVEDWKTNQFSSYPDLMERVKSGIQVNVTKTSKNEVSLAIEFENWNMFGLFYGYAQAEDFEYSKFLEDKGPFIDNILNNDYADNEYGLFIIKYSILKSSGLDKEIENFEVDGVNYYNKYKEYFMNRYGMEDVDISQLFAYPDNRLHGNADDSYVEADMTVLTWNLSDKSEDFEMKIYKVTANSSTWYILALILSAIFCIIISIVIVKKNKGQIVQIIEKKDLDK